jgi:hypothetical protein
VIRSTFCPENWVHDEMVIDIDVDNNRFILNDQLFKMSFFTDFMGSSFQVFNEAGNKLCFGGKSPADKYWMALGGPDDMFREDESPFIAAAKILANIL